MRNFHFVFLAILFMTNACTNKQVSVIELKCEYIANPLGIDILNPRLSWKLESPTNGQKQTAYQIIVSSTQENLEANIGDLWNTEIVNSEQSLHVKYEGRKLRSGEEAFWKVRVWDREGNDSEWSETAKWEMGLNTLEWEAEWIGLSKY